MAENKDTFSQWIPVHLIKGKDGKVGEMKLAGIASTPSEDDDGEFLDPNGFDLSYFIESGFMNWNHQATKDPSALIGRPSKAQVTEKGLEIETTLFKTSEKAKQVYQLAETLEAEGLALGFSIEGKALQRDENDPRRVLKARITGCAITPNPKNKDAVAMIIKGQNYDKLSAYQDEDEETVAKAMEAGGASGNAISKESLKPELVVTEFTDEEAKKLGKKLSKGDVYGRLFELHPNLDGLSCDRLYKLMCETEKAIQMSKKDQEKFEVSEEAFQKALDVIGDLSKGHDDEEEDEDDEFEEEEEDEDDSFEKGDNYDEEDEDDSDDEDGDDSDDEDEEEPTPMKKGKSKMMKKGITEDHLSAARTILEQAGFSVEEKGSSLNKGHFDDDEDDSIAELIKGMGDDLRKSISKDFGRQLKKVDPLITLTKGLISKVNALEEELDVIGHNTSGRKSVTRASAIEKSFENDNDLNKGANAEGDEKQLSASLHKGVICNLLEKHYWSDEDGGKVTNPQLAHDTQVYEVSGQLTKGIIDAINKDGFTLLK